VRDLTRATADLMRRNLQEMRAGWRALLSEEDPRASTGDFGSALLRWAHAIGVAMLAGLVTGALVIGLGGRLAMRISGILGGQTGAGLLTENNNVVGEITAGGTLSMVVGGAIDGVLLGMLYVAVRPLLTPLGRWQPLAFGVLFFLTFGFTIIDSGNSDFQRFGPPVVNVALFASIFVVFGMALASLTAGLDPRDAAAPGARRMSIGRVKLTTLLTVLLAVPVLAASWQTVVSIARILTGR
jgi:hypothetical protein